jgi:hypothetical protein
MSEITGAIVTIVTAIIGLAILAVIVSRNSATAGVITSAASGLAADIAAATNPGGGQSFGFAGLPPQ